MVGDFSLVLTNDLFRRNNNSLVGMSVSTASAASKTLNDLISQQQVNINHLHRISKKYEW